MSKNFCKGVVQAKIKRIESHFTGRSIYIIKATELLMNKLSLSRALFASFVSGIVFLGVLTPQIIIADYEKPKFCEAPMPVYGVAKTVKMVITAYSSTPEQTDSTPFVTASGKKVADGIIANNMLPFGTRIRIPSVYGDKIFIVEDRMHRRKGKYHVDIWFPEYEQAKEFGAKLADVEILES